MSAKPVTGRKSEKIWRDAILVAVHRKDKGDDRIRLAKLAEQLVQQGLQGEVQALKEIGDRIDGKPNIIVEGDPDNPLHAKITFQWKSQSTTSPAPVSSPGTSERKDGA
jgi:hypothetical protein